MNNLRHLLTPEQFDRLLEVLKRKQGQTQEYRPTYGELKMAWRAKNNIK